MRERITARVLLLDPEDRLLLMKGRLPSRPHGPGAWFTVGGGAKPGESVAAAARRELREETGFEPVELGPVIWYRESVLELEGREAVLFKESYLIARCGGGEPSRDGWDDHERRFIDDIRWWSLAEIRASAEPIYPEGLAELLEPVIAGALPDDPMIITRAASPPAASGSGPTYRD